MPRLIEASGEESQSSYVETLPHESGQSKKEENK